jgi:hypothetical protein
VGTPIAGICAGSFANLNGKIYQEECIGGVGVSGIGENADGAGRRRCGEGREAQAVKEAVNAAARRVPRRLVARDLPR